MHRDGSVATKGVRGVGYVRDLWGSSEVAIAIEARLAKLDVLAEPDDDLDAEQSAGVEARLRGDGVHADTLWRRVIRFASFLCSMHWTLVEFEDDWLITGDQPVVLLPPIPQLVTPASALLPAGLSYTLEGRFTPYPRRALLMTWSEDPEERGSPGRMLKPAA